MLILDEATSNLDSVNEHAAHRAPGGLPADRTTRVIAPGLSTVRDAALIVALNQSRVAETRTIDALLDSTPGFLPAVGVGEGITEAGRSNSDELDEQSAIVSIWW